MAEHLLTSLDPSTRVRKRAEYEAFAFSLIEGDVLVRNESHADPENHEYRVTIENGIPKRCECPADTHTEEACKHRIALAIRDKILEAATEYRTLADGGPKAEPETDSGGDEHTEDSTPDSSAGCEHLDGFPCWECVRTGKRTLPDEDTNAGTDDSASSV
jgi:hypothetical protein